MVVILINSIQPFCVHYQDLNLFSIGSCAHQRLCPEPNTLSARINGWADSKAIWSIEKHTVQKIAFASAVLTSDRNNSKRLFEICKELLAILVNLKL